MKGWPRVPSWGNLSEFFPRDVRKKIYAYLGNIDKIILKESHGVRALNKENSYRLTSVMAYNNNLNLLQWAYSRGVNLDSDVCYFAACNDNMEMLKWARARNCKRSKHALLEAARKGNLEMVKFLREYGCKWDNIVLYAAIESKNIELVKWMLEDGCMTSTRAWDYVAGSLEMAKLLHKHKCRWNGLVISEFCRSGQLDMVKWAVEQGCPRREKSMLLAASTDKAVIDWITNHLPN